MTSSSLQHHPLTYTIRRNRRARSIKISVKRDLSVVVTLPYMAPEYLARKFVGEKEDWIRKKLEAFGKSQVRVMSEERGYKESKDAALALVKQLIAKYSTEYDFPYNRITIKNHKTRWGSCSAKKNLNFNYKILFLPRRLAEYIVVHELCHLREMNHSARFWDLVSRTFPDYKALRKEFRGI